MPPLSVPAKKISRNVNEIFDSGSYGLFVSCCFASYLSPKPHDQVEINIASLNGVEKELKDVFFDVTIEVRNSFVSMPAIVADGLILDVLLGTN